MSESIENLTGFTVITIKTPYFDLAANTKSEDELNFMELCALRIEIFANIEHYIADWHSDPDFSALPLHEFLGMTSEEYAWYVELRGPNGDPVAEYARYVELRGPNGDPVAEEEVLKSILENKKGEAQVFAFYVYDTAQEWLYVSLNYISDRNELIEDFYYERTKRVILKMERHEMPKECIESFLRDVMDGFHTEQRGENYILTQNQFILSSTGCSRVKVVKVEGEMQVPYFLLPIAKTP
jgi:hypothetical protein